jgi:iron complex outermembrane receptor protein
LSGRNDWAKAVTRDLIASSVSEQNDRKFTGRAGLSYSAPFGLAPYISYSTSFLPTVGVDIYGKPYRPLSGSQFETGIKFQPAGWSSFITASFFNINEQNVQTTDPANPINSIQVGEVRSRGAEVEGVVSLRYGLTLHAGYSYDDARVTRTTVVDQLGRYMLSVPRETASSYLDYSVPRGPLMGLGSGFGVRHVGLAAGSPDNSLMVPGYTLFDGSIYYDWRSLRLSVDGTNLGDRRYVGVCTSLDYCNYGFARRVIGRVLWRW